MKISLIVLGGLAASFFLRHRSAALRHWVLAAAITCAAAVPLIEAIVPAWRLPIAAPAAFEPYVEEAQHSGSDRAGRRSWCCAAECIATALSRDGWCARLRSCWNALVDMDCRHACQRLDPCRRYSPDEMARCASEACDARTVERPGRRDLAGLRPSTQRRIARKRASVAAGHLGIQGAQGDPARDCRCMVRRADARRADARARSHPPWRLGGADCGRSAARRVLVQSPAVDRVQEAPSRERTCVR